MLLRYVPPNKNEYARKSIHPEQYGRSSFLKVYFSRQFNWNCLGSELRKKLSSNMSRFESLSGYKFNDFTDMSEFPIVPMAQWVEQKCSEALGTGSDPKPYQHFCLLKRRYIRITHTTHSQGFRFRIFLKQKSVVLRTSPVLWDKKLSTGSREKSLFCKISRKQWLKSCL